MTGPSRRDFLVRAGALGLSTSSLATLLSACSRDEEGFGARRTPRPSSSADRKLRGRLVVGIIQDPPDAAKEALTKAYRQRQPDVELVWETKDFGGPDGYVNWLGTQLAAGKVRPDIVSGNYVPTFRGYLNFEEYRNAVNPYTGNPWSKDLDFDSGRELNAWAERYLLTTQAAHVNWFYNKALLDRADVEPPATWAEFANVCAALQAADVTPVSANFQWQVPQWLTEIYFDQYHVDWVETVRAREGDWNFDPEVDGKFSLDPAEPNIHSLYTYSPQRFYQGLADHTLRFDTPAMADLVGNFAKVFPKYAPKLALLSLLPALWRTLVVSVVSIVGIVTVSTLASYAFARISFPGREVLYHVVLAVMTIPGIILLTPHFVLANQLGMVGSLWGLIAFYIAGGLPFGIFLITTFFRSQPGEMFEAARVDGASELQTMIRIALPLAIPIVVTVAMMNFLSIYGDFIWPTLIVSKDNETLLMALQAFNPQVDQFANRPDFGVQAAGYAFATLPQLIVFTLGMKYFVAGVTSGAVKA
ncbi:ABC transporter permease subunit [Actinopolymorpha alba]|uniref:ABC transporter permease subunit n=1 Tax=Actinopolymorpha alba TaxID=533267 RepID=UPI000367B401|nr:ABC transporter permease subunit [Actinopolymorpha alba]